MKRFYPLLLDVSGRRCVVVGGGQVGTRKVRPLIEAEADVVAISPEVSETLEKWAKEGRLEWLQRTFVPTDVDGAYLVFGATNDAAVNRDVAEAAEKNGILFNNARGPDGADFHVPSTVRRGGLTVTVSTGGGSPAYARLVRERLEDTFGPEHAEVGALFEDLRARVMERFPDNAARRRAFWKELVSWEMVDWVRDGNEKAIEERVTQCLSS